MPVVLGPLRTWWCRDAAVAAGSHGPHGAALTIFDTILRPMQAAMLFSDTYVTTAAGLPLPRSVSMSYEMDKMFPYNAGIIVANLPVMRRNYKAFLTMMLDNDNGLYYPNYGPADQGIINKASMLLFLACPCSYHRCFSSCTAFAQPRASGEQRRQGAVLPGLVLGLTLALTS